MTVEEIKRKHGLLVEGYEGMLPESKTKYHTQTTLQAILDELEEVNNWRNVYSVDAIMELLEARVRELQKLIDNQ